MLIRLGSKCMIALALFTGLGADAAPQISAKPHDRHAGDQGNGRCLVVQSQVGTDETPIVVRATPQPKSTTELAKEKQDREQREHNDDLLVKFNGVLALFTIVLALSTIFLWLETRRLRQLADRQAADMKDSLALTKRSVDAAVALELPLFVIESFTIEPNSATYTISLGNHGRTPAIITETSFVTVLTHALPPSPRYPAHSVDQVEVSRVVEKGHEFPISRSSMLSEDDWNRVLKGETILWAYGYLDYVDFLKMKRRTGFCLAFMPRPDKLYPSTSTSKGDWVQQGPSAYTYDRLRSDVDLDPLLRHEASGR